MDLKLRCGNVRWPLIRLMIMYNNVSVDPSTCAVLHKQCGNHIMAYFSTMNSFLVLKRFIV